MRWQYRTVVFEFQKDGLLGDRFIDDEEVENTLNEQGRAGWELVSATMVQEGLLTLLKRPERESAGHIGADPEPERTVSPESGVRTVTEPVPVREGGAEISTDDPDSGPGIGSIRIR